MPQSPIELQEQTTEIVTENTIKTVQEESVKINHREHNAVKILTDKKFSDKIKEKIKKSFGSFCNDKYIWTVPLIQKIPVECFLEKEGVEFILENTFEEYHSLTSDKQKAKRLEQAKLINLQKSLVSLSTLQEYIEDYNSYWETNLTVKNLDGKSIEELKEFASSGDPRQIGHLETLLGMYRKFDDLRDKDKQTREKIIKLKEQGEEQVFDLILNQKSPYISAEKLIKREFQHGGYSTIYYCGDAFWQWTGACYVELRPNRVRQFIYDFLNEAKTETVKDGSVILNDFNPNQSKVNNVLDAFQAKSECGLIPESGSAWIKNDKFPDVENLIVFKNGILDVQAWLNEKTTKLIPHTPLLMNPGYLSFDFEPYEQEPIEWLEFLRSIWPDDQESIDTLQEWFGYALTQNTSFHKILLIVGPPRSGKGTIGRIMRSLLGERNVVGPTLSSLSSPFGLQPWLNKSHAIISDARLSGKSDQKVITERLLSISGVDPLTIDRKHREPITTTLPTRITVMTNELPNLGDSSGAIVNRFIILPMTKSWLGEEDLDLEIRIRKELPQILVWSLNGLKRLKERNRFTQPESAKLHLEEMMAMSSPINTFISERCELGSDKWIETKTLFNAWVKSEILSNVVYEIEVSASNF